VTLTNRVSGLVGLEVTGTPFEHGGVQGAALREEIAVNLGQVDAVIDGLGVDRDGYAEYVAVAAEHLQRHDPGTIDEIRGISEGSGLRYEDVLRLNIPLYMVMRRSMIVDDCSIFSLAGSASVDGKTYLVKTRDQPVDQFAYEHVVLTRRYDDGTAIIEVNAAGIITNPGNGINDAGLAVGTAGVWSKDRMGVQLRQLSNSSPMPDMHYLLRHATTVAEARDLWEDWPRLVGMNLLVADAEGGMGTIELTSTEVLWTERTALGCGLTNHYVSDPIAGLSSTREENPSTYSRLDFISEQLDDPAAPLGRDELFALMTDTSHGTQDSIWRTLPGGSVTRYGSITCIDDRTVTSWGEDLGVAPVEALIA
jgi:isopenicillin-N N-acyltransferase-like protein